MQSDLKYFCSLCAFHWLVVLAVLIAVAAIEVFDLFPEGSAGHAALLMLRQTVGLSVLTLMVLRLLARVATQAPPPVPGIPLIQFVARLTYDALYALMVGMSLLGLLALAWGGKSTQPFGPDLPLAVAQDKTLAYSAKEVYESGAVLVYIAAGLHAAATLWRGFILKDRLLCRTI